MAEPTSGVAATGGEPGRGARSARSTWSPPVPDAPRQMPRWSDLEPFLRLRAWQRDPVARRLARCVSIEDLERMARRRVPGAVFDYVHSGADGEVAMRRNREIFDRVELRPTAFRQAGVPATDTTILGRPAAAPLIIAPTGYSRLSHHQGESAAAAAAAHAGVPFTLSTYGTTSIADLARAAPGGRNWFQMYLMKDRAVSLEHLAQAREHGYETLVLTIDTTVSGNKRSDVRNGFAIPPQLTARTMADMATRPRWVMDILTTRPLRFATFPEGSSYGRWGMSNSLREQHIRPDDVAWLTRAWDGPVVVKGVLSVSDALLAVDAGADALVLSNHGGRQLDRAPVPLELLPDVAAAVGDRCEIYLDSGVRDGGDVLAALALGARAVMIGRAHLYGLMVGGQRGVDRALEIITAELGRAMALVGAESPADIRAEHARLRAV